MFNDGQEVEKADEEQGHGTHDDQNERKTVQPQTSGTNTSYTFLRVHIIAHHTDNLYISTINWLVQFVNFPLVAKDSINQVAIF